MKEISVQNYGIEFEAGVNDDSVGVTPAENADPKQNAILWFPKFGVTPELEDQLEAVNTDPTAMLASLKANNITIEEISKEDREKFALDLHPLHEEHLKQAA